MTQLRYAVLSLVFILSLTACSTANKPTPAQPATTATNPSPTTQQTTVTASPSPSAKPTASQSSVSTPNSPKTASTITVTPKPTIKATPKEETAIVKILSVTSPAPRNSTATLKAKVAPGATASIVVHYKSGPSKAAGLESKKADSDGNVSWSWHVGGNTTLGNWKITVSSGNSSAETTFEVVH